MQLFIRLENGKPVGFPVIEDNVRFMFPSLPKRYLHAGDLINTGFGVLQATTPPVVPDPTYKVIQVDPIRRNENLEWIQRWDVVKRDDLTKEQEEKLLFQYEEDTKHLLSVKYREYRNTLLSSSDWTQVPDAPVDQAAWRTYRQALRDVTTQSGFPHEVTWPVKPE